MGLFDIFKKKESSAKNSEDFQQRQSKSNALDETKPLTQGMISFEERKKTAVPSKGGLYPAEILLLEYCSKGKYPMNKYPEFWKFEYGIFDVDAMLKTLESRGYIVLSSAKESVSGLTVQQLKQLLLEQGQPISGRKADLIERVVTTVPDECIIAFGAQRKFKLTPHGKQELSENEYVPYMHKSPHKTLDGAFGSVFNVWSINKLLGEGDKSDWKAVVQSEEQKLIKEISDRNVASRQEIKRLNPELYKLLREQDQQILEIDAARNTYDENHDLNSYIMFWETLWANGGLKFEGVRWHFELADMYIKAKRYSEALTFLKMIKKRKPSYAYKADTYIERIKKLMSKQNKKK